MVGPILGGFITDQSRGVGCFLSTFPIGVVAAIIIGFALKEPRRTEQTDDRLSRCLTLMLAISLLMLALVEGGKSLTVLFAPENLAILISSIILLVLFVLIERRAKDPIIPFKLFQNRTITVATIAGFLAGVAMFGGISFIPLFAQGALGMTATQAGSLLTPLMLSWVAMSVIVGRLMLKIGYKIITIAGFSVMAAGFIMLSNFHRQTPTSWLYLDLALIGTGLGLTMLTLLIAVQQSVERSQLGIATSLNQFSRAIGGALGVAIMGAVLTAGLSTQLLKAASRDGSGLTADQAQNLGTNPNTLIEPAAKASLPPGILPVLQDSMAAAIQPVFWVVVLVCLLALIASFFLPKERVSRERADDNVGETMLMAEQTTINARNQPACEGESS